MKTMMRTAILVLLLPLAGCSFLDKNDSAPAESEGEVINVRADEAEVLSVRQRSVAFAFKGELPSPCYTFEEVAASRDGRTIHVKVRARSTADFCIGVIGTLGVSPLEVAVPEPGTYTFAFWRGPDAAPLEVKVEVP